MRCLLVSAGLLHHIGGKQHSINKAKAMSRKPYRVNFLLEVYRELSRELRMSGVIGSFGTVGLEEILLALSRTVLTILLLVGGSYPAVLCSQEVAQINWSTVAADLPICMRDRR